MGLHRTGVGIGMVRLITDLRPVINAIGAFFATK
jgi:hypothetical protein